MAAHFNSGLPPLDFKMAILGDSKVGKTSLFLRSLFKQPFNAEHDPTVDDYFVHGMNLDGVHLNVCIVDTAGSFCFPVMRRFAISYCQGFVVTYALNDARSFDTAMSSLDELIDMKSGLGPEDKRIPVILVANKLDCGEREVPAARAQNELDARPWILGMYTEVSAKVNNGIDGIFYSLISLIQALSNKDKSKTRFSLRNFRKSWRKQT